MIYIFLSTFTHLSLIVLLQKFYIHKQYVLNNSTIYRSFTYTNMELIFYGIHVYTEVRGVHQIPCAIRGHTFAQVAVAISCGKNRTSDKMAHLSCLSLAN